MSATSDNDEFVSRLRPCFPPGLRPALVAAEALAQERIGGIVRHHRASRNEWESRRPAHQLVTLEIDAVDADASGYEPVWRDGKKVGFVTSGGYGHTIGKSLAMAMVAPEAAAIGGELAVHVVGAERRAGVIAPSPYDPDGKAMRA